MLFDDILVNENRATLWPAAPGSGPAAGYGLRAARPADASPAQGLRGRYGYRAASGHRR